MRNAKGTIMLVVRIKAHVVGLDFYVPNFGHKASGIFMTQISNSEVVSFIFNLPVIS